MLVEETRAAHVRPLTEARDEIEKALRAQEEQRLRKEWLDRLKAKSFIKYLPLN
jgi:parvulin-like peptidyl-prolyl isomerase